MSSNSVVSVIIYHYSSTFLHIKIIVFPSDSVGGVNHEAGPTHKKLIVFNVFVIIIFLGLVPFNSTNLALF